MNSELPSTLRNLARYQSGVVSRSQALRTGLSADMIKFRLRSGRWESIHRGAGAAISYETAAELHGLIDKGKVIGPVHVTVPHERRVTAVEGVSLHRSDRSLEAMQGHAYPPRTRIEETVLDLTQTAKTFDDICGWVTRAFARDLTDGTRLREAMKARKKLRWRADLHELIVAADGGDHSVLEFRYHSDVERAHGLPEPRRQVPFTGPGARRGRRDRVYGDYPWWSS